MDDIDQLLTPTSLPSRDNDAEWQQTRGVLRRRRWTRRGGAVALMAACFFAGAWAFRLAPAGIEQTQLARDQRPKNVAIPEPKTDSLRNAAPHRIERWADIASGDRQVELYRRAGDGYLRRGDDLAALRCYRQALDGGGPTQLVVRDDDTWLMMSLKLARQKERN